MEKKRDYLLPVSVLIAAALVAGALIYSTGAKNTNPNNQNPDTNAPTKITSPQINNAAVLGDPQAQLTIFVFSDYQCPYCGKFYNESEKLIRQNYVDTGKANMVYKTLAFLGQESTSAANAAECAKDQEKFWQYHDAILDIEVKEFRTLGNNENTGNLTKELFKNIASDLGMNVNDFLACFETQKYSAEIQSNSQEASQLMERVSTPTIFIGDEMIQGAYPYDVFKQVLDAALNTK